MSQPRDWRTNNKTLWQDPHRRKVVLHQDPKYNFCYKRIKEEKKSVTQPAGNEVIKMNI